jgi:ubiquinone/menaquinone biosynthesis C-methylase UbiE
LEGIPQSSVDRAAMILTLHHSEDRIRAFKNVRRVLKPDGALYIFDPIASRMLGHGTNPEKKLLKSWQSRALDMTGSVSVKDFCSGRLQPDLKLRFLK